MSRSMTIVLGCCLLALCIIPAQARAQNSRDKAKKAKPAAEKPATDQAANGKAKDAKAKDAKTNPKKQPDQPAEASKGKAPAKPEAKPAPPKPEAKPEAKKPETHTVKPELLKIDVSVKGSFEAKAASEVVLRPESWSTYRVLKVVEHGQKVSRGDVLIEFDARLIDRAIADQKTKIELSKLALKQAEENLRNLEKLTTLDLTALDRTKQMNEEDYQRYLKVDRPRSKRIADFNLESSQNYLDYQSEELAQLEKMYEADDLTEETEEIILRRQRDAVKRAQFILDLEKVYHDEDINIRMPRRDESMEQMMKRGKLSYALNKATLPTTLRRTQLDLETMKVKLARDDKVLEKLLADRELMRIEAPVDGLAYYGKFTRGVWSGSSSSEKLRTGGSVSANSVFMTVVKPEPLGLRVKILEKDFDQIRPGLRGKVLPTAFPDVRLDATVAKVNPVPVASGSFEVQLRLAVPDGTKTLLPGMACSVKFTPYLNRKALTVPTSAVKADELDDQKHFVMFVADDGKQKKRRVEVGKKAKTRVEILLGLEEGDQVIKEFPKDES